MNSGNLYNYNRLLIQPWPHAQQRHYASNVSRLGHDAWDCNNNSDQVCVKPASFRSSKSTGHDSAKGVNPGCGTYLLSGAAWIVHYRRRAAKSIDFILKFHLCFTAMKSDFSWLTIQISAYRGASFWPDVVLQLK